MPTTPSLHHVSHGGWAFRDLDHESHWPQVIGELSKYRQLARCAAELNLGGYVPLCDAQPGPELGPNQSAQSPQEAQRRTISVG